MPGMPSWLAASCLSNNKICKNLRNLFCWISTALIFQAYFNWRIEDFYNCSHFSSFCVQQMLIFTHLGGNYLRSTMNSGDPLASQDIWCNLNSEHPCYARHVWHFYTQICMLCRALYRGVVARLEFQGIKFLYSIDSDNLSLLNSTYFQLLKCSNFQSPGMIVLIYLICILSPYLCVLAGWMIT